MEPKIHAMIPCKANSSRVYQKNQRYLNGLQLPAWAIRTCKRADIFDDIWIYSCDKEMMAIAMAEGVKFFREPEVMTDPDAMNDDFAFNFIENVACDILIQVNTTSPFVTYKDVNSFVHYFINGKYDTLLSVKKEQIETIYRGKPVNFNKKDKMRPSQELEPVLIYTSSIMGWRTSTYKRSYMDYGYAVHGPIGLTGYYEMSGISTIDIDTEDDWKFAEKIARTL